MNPDQLLERIATTLKRDIGPAVLGDYPKTQAFMAAVVLQKLGRQLGLLHMHPDRVGVLARHAGEAGFEAPAEAAERTHDLEAPGNRRRDQGGCLVGGERAGLHAEPARMEKQGDIEAAPVLQIEACRRHSRSGI